jgi:hypothetical protein
MKATVGAIRQIVREEAERLNEQEEEDTPEAAAEAAISDMDMLKWARTDMQEILKDLPNRWNDELKGMIIDFAELLAQNPAGAKVIIAKTDAAAKNRRESFDRDGLRKLIMAEANDLLGE